VKSILTNDENSTDDEMRAHFIEGGLTEAEADEWVTRRSFYRNNIVMEDDDHNDIGIFNPHTGVVKPLPDVFHSEDASGKSRFPEVLSGMGRR
jgi:hypothetical protein